MAIFEWRKFNFFDLRKGVDKDSVSGALQGVKITATANGSSLIVICDSNGYIHTFSRTWSVISFKGHEGSILLCDIAKPNNLLVTVGEDINGPSFKVWNLSKVSATNGAQCLRTVRTMVSVPTALAVSEGGQFMAIGFAQGNISLYRGDISRDRSKTLKQLTAGTSDIAGIAFKHCHKHTQMFVCSNSGVYLYNLHSRDKEIRVILATMKKPVGCCALQTGHNEGHFMVGLDDAVYCYTSDGRGPCYALEGNKTLLHWYRSHLLVVMRNPRSPGGFNLTVIDIQNKFIVFTSPIDEVSAILTDFGTCYILTENKQILHLDEKDLQSKLNMLFKKNLYDIAVRIAKCNQYDAEGLAGIFKQYGDHLYSKGDFAGAVEQYAKTIGHLEPSYVIQRFLDARHIHFLTDYLQTIHAQGRATADHTTLLLNCFTRLDRTVQLKEFLKNDQKSNLFDIDVAIKVCRDASYVDEALQLAKAHRKHDACLSILTEDMGQYEEALSYIESLTCTDAERSIKRYGSVLMTNCPTRTIALLKKLCTEHATNANSTQGRDALTVADLSILTEDMGQYEEALSYIESLTCTDAERSIKRYGSVLMTNCPTRTIALLKKLCTEHATNANSTQGRDALTVADLLSDLNLNDERGHGNPEDFIHLFDDVELLIDFLEHLIRFVPASSQSVYSTLIEHYLYKWKENASVEEKLLDLLKYNTERYDKNHALAQCRVHEFWPGVMYLYEEDKLYHLIIRHYLRHRQYDELLACCRKLAHNNTSLWLLTLNGLKNDAQAPPHLFNQILQVISQKRLQAPLQVLDCLAVDQGPAFLSVKDYFMQVFQKEQDTIRSEEEQARTYREESASIKRYIKHLQEGNVEFQNTTCDACKQPLSMPALFFLCKHSYHQDCIRSYTDTERDCPVCNKNNIQLIEALRAQSEARDQHEMFHDLLDRSPEPFSVVADYFGRGLFNKLLIVEEGDPQMEIMEQPKQAERAKASPVASYEPRVAPAQPTPYTSEARLRQDEGRSAQKRIESQESEMRLRVMEQERIRQRQQATTIVQQQMKLRDDRSPKMQSPYGSPRLPTVNPFEKSNISSAKAVSSARDIAKIPIATTARNPFEEDEAEYDNTKNPFDEGTVPVQGRSQSDRSAGKNPFEEEYDSKLDPFAE